MNSKVNIFILNKLCWGEIPFTYEVIALKKSELLKLI